VIFYVRLISGVEMVGEKVQEDSNFLTLKRPHTIHVKEDMNTFMLLPYCLGTTYPVVNKKYILQFGEAHSSFASVYSGMMQRSSGTYETDISDDFEDSDEELKQVSNSQPTFH